MTQNSVSAAGPAKAATPTLMTGSEFVLCPCDRVCIYCPSCGYKLGSKFRVCACNRVCNYCLNCGYSLVYFVGDSQQQLSPTPSVDGSIVDFVGDSQDQLSHTPSSVDDSIDIDASRVLYFHSEHSGMNSWYRVDLDRLPDKLFPIAERSTKLGEGLGFIFIGDDLYCNGGLRHSSRRPISWKLLKYNTGNPNSKWEAFAVCSYPLGYQPFMFSFDSKIYVMRGNMNPSYTKKEKSVSQIYWGRAFHLNTGEFDAVAPIPNSAGRLVHSVPTLMGINTVVLFSLDTGTLFSYNATENSWRSALHPSLALSGLDVLPELKGCESISLLRKLLTRRAPLVRDSTLYWFSTDLHLYGYDTVQEIWLVSNRIKRKLLTLGRKFLPLPLDPDSLFDSPMLVDLSHGKFLLLVRFVLSKRSLTEQQYTPFLAMATLSVDKKACALDVSVEKCHIVPVDRSFMLSSGMSMLKTAQ